jgi:aminopeptidase C
VYQIVVRRDLLSEEQKALLNLEPTPMTLWDPFS